MRSLPLRKLDILPRQADFLQRSYAVCQNQPVGLVLKERLEHVHEMVGVRVAHGDFVYFWYAQHCSFPDVGIGVGEGQLQGFDEILVELWHSQAAHGSNCQRPEQRVALVQRVFSEEVDAHDGIVGLCARVVDDVQVDLHKGSCLPAS